MSGVVAWLADGAAAARRAGLGEQARRHVRGAPLVNVVTGSY